MFASANLPATSPALMPPLRSDLGASRCLSGMALAVSLLLAQPARAEEPDVPPYPPRLSEDLLRPSLPAVTTAPPPTLAVSIEPTAAAATGKPLPPGATAALRLIVRNVGTAPAARVALIVRVDGLKPEPPAGWRTDGGALTTDIARLAPGATAEQRLALAVDKAPPNPGAIRVVVEARTASERSAVVSVEIKAADCAAAYHARLGVIRTGALQSAKMEADAIRKGEAGFPHTRLFPPVAGRNAQLAAVERLAGYYLARGGADDELGRDPLRFNFVRWASDLTAYTGQAANPALCSGALMVVGRYREAITPTMRRVEAVRAAAARALELARSATEAAADDDLPRVVRRAIERVGIESDRIGTSPLHALAAARAALGPDRTLEPALAEALSIAETAAVLAEATRRIDRVGGAIDMTLSAIADAARTSCVCAY
jgi:hypothetical protein